MSELCRYVAGKYLIHSHNFLDPFVFLDPFNNFVEANIVLDQPFDPNLEDKTSQEFLDLQAKLTAPLKDQYCGPIGPCCDISVTSFRQGSVIAQLLVSIATSELSRCDITATLATQMGSLPASIGGISVTPGSLAACK